LATHPGDAALFHAIAAHKPELVRLTLFSWNIEHRLHLAQRLQAAWNPMIVLGGPEVTPDSTLLTTRFSFFFVRGEGKNF
jgi:hypothetical protein